MIDPRRKNNLRTDETREAFYSIGPVDSSENKTKQQFARIQVSENVLDSYFIMIE